MKPLALLLICILFTSTGQLILKKGMLILGPIETLSLSTFDIFFNPYVLLGIIFNLGGWILYILALSKSELSLAYPIWSLTFVIVPTVSILIFKESISIMKLCGFGFVCIGICLVIISRWF